MSLYRICQQCAQRENEWTVKQATLHVGDIDWKLALCERCTKQLQLAIEGAFGAPPKRP